MGLNVQIVAHKDYADLVIEHRLAIEMLEDIESKLLYGPWPTEYDKNIARQGVELHAKLKQIQASMSTPEEKQRFKHCVRILVERVFRVE
jgi:hypothetical protein